jgi:uncharacterized protein YchJ
MTREFAVQHILALGFGTLTNPKRFSCYYQGWGSIANGMAVTLSVVETKTDPADEEHQAVFVKFKAWRESGEDLMDYCTEESRWVRVDQLQQYLEGKGIRFRKEEKYA